ncbi:MAG TPA: EF-hand domain-containing protein [Rhizomicrobium sp.]|nr:EF-hand domain-containing protein [Rhizomicrobium sp.]
MARNIKIALLVGATALFGSATLAFAHMDGPPPPDGPMEGIAHRPPFADRMLEEFDSNKDGKITKAEFNGVIGARFSAATHGRKAMTPEEFAAIHQGDFERHAADMFHRLDWNGDGKLTLDEFVAPQRAHFQMMDRDGSGTVSCNPYQHADFRQDADRGRNDGGFHRRSGFDYERFALQRFCNDSDVTRDGKVTRAEFDTAMNRHFQEASNGQPAMTLAQFAAQMAVRYREMNDRMFARLDEDGDGTLTMAEFSASELRTFDRLDRNHDGAIDAEELKPRDRGDGGRGRDQHSRDDDRGAGDDN